MCVHVCVCVEGSFMLNQISVGVVSSVYLCCQLGLPMLSWLDSVGHLSRRACQMQGGRTCHEDGHERERKEEIVKVRHPWGL